MNTLEPKAAFKIGEATIPVSKVTLTHGIDELPHAEVFVQLDNQTNTDDENQIGVVNMDISKFNWLMKLTQEKILNEYKIDPDTQLQIEDGTGSRILLKGFLGRPMFQLREGELNLGFSIVHAKSVLQAFNSTIYGAQELYTGTIPGIFFEADAETEAARNSNSVAQSVRVVLDGMLKGAVHIPDLVNSDVYDSYPMHLLNLTAVPKVREFLKASIETTRIAGLDMPEMRTNFELELWNILTNAPNFFQAIQFFCQAFMLQMNAEYDGRAWLEWTQANTQVGARVIEVPLQNVVFSMANIYQLPVLQVMVQGRGSSLYAVDGNMSVLQGGPNAPSGGSAAPALQEALKITGDPGIQLTSLAKWPTAVPRDAVGVLYVVDAPNWITPDEFTVPRVNILEALASGSREEAIIKQYEEAKSHMVGADRARQQICEFMARQYFRSLVLGDTNAAVSIPLNTEIRPGYMYLMKSVTGEELFTAYLTRVVHDLMVTPDNTGAAMSHLTFSHVRVISADINAFQDPPKFTRALVTPMGKELPAALTTNFTGLA